MARPTDEEIIRALKHRVVDLQERLAASFDDNNKLKGYRSMFKAVQEGFIEVREKYKLLQSENPQLPEWERFIKMADADVERD